MTTPQPEHVHINVDPAVVLRGYAQHRRRFAAAVASMDADALAAPTRCTDWSVADTLRHCIDVDDWMHAIWAHEALPFKGFDPKTTPQQFVDAARDVPDTEIRDRHVASSEVVASEVEAADEDRWGQPSLSPMGLVPWWLNAQHMFWDSWSHERDILLPQGRTVPSELDEVVPILCYVLAFTGVLGKTAMDVELGGVRLVAGEPPVQVTPVAPRADVADIIDALSGRADISIITAQANPSVDWETLPRFLLPNP